MRLTCPNCAAQYEIDGGMIPPPGRDVQCSNCGHAWFQLAETVAPAASGAGEAGQARPRDQAAGAAGPGPARDPAEPGPAPAPAPAVEAEAQPEAQPEPGLPVGVAGTDTEADEAEPLWPDVGPAGLPAGPSAAGLSGAEAAAQVRRPPLDSAVMELLRQEAEREAAARRAEARAAMESQPDLGLPVPPARPAQPVERRADLAGMDPADAAAAEAAAAQAVRPRRMTLPAVEEINSTLAGRGTVPGLPEATLAETSAGAGQRRGFRIGFLAMILIAALVILAYLQGERLAVAWPAAEPAIEAFTRRVDAGRVWLDRAARSASETIRGLATSGDPPP